MRLVTIALGVVLALGLVSPAVAADRGTVTRAEFSKVRVGMTKAKVERIFDAQGKCSLRYAYRGERFEMRQYSAPSSTGVGFFTSITYRLTRSGAVVAEKAYRDPPVSSESC